MRKVRHTNHAKRQVLRATNEIHLCVKMSAELSSDNFPLYHTVITGDLHHSGALCPVWQWQSGSGFRGMCAQKESPGKARLPSTSSRSLHRLPSVTAIYPKVAQVQEEHRLRVCVGVARPGKSRRMEDSAAAIFDACTV